MSAPTTKPTLGLLRARCDAKIEKIIDTVKPKSPTESWMGGLFSYLCNMKPIKDMKHPCGDGLAIISFFFEKNTG